MADLVSPDQIRSSSFRTTFRGFDQSEVAEFLDRIARTIEGLNAERSRLSARAEGQLDGDLRTEFQRVSAEVGEVLEAARLAAEGMRERAATEVAEWRRSATEAAVTARRDAQSDSEALRGDAWATAKAMLDQSQVEAKKIAATAEREALAIVGHAERESHRSQAAARREADELVRTAKMESERLLADARAQHDEIIDTARKQAEAAQERARALEVRRDELLAELETVRSKIHAMETDIEERRKPMPAESSQRASVRLIPAEEPAAAEPPPPDDWSPADSVRVIPPAAKKIDSGEPVDAAALADEVRRLRKTVPPKVSAGEPAAGVEDEHPTEPGVDDAVVEDQLGLPPVALDESEFEDVTVVVIPAEATDEPKVAAESEPPAPEEDWALDSLFATLRHEPEDEAPPAAPESPDEPEAREVPPQRPEPEAQRHEPPPTQHDAIAVRDQMLLPITNRVLREVKRQLTEAQNLTLEGVRVTEAWDPELFDVAERVRGDLLVLVQESYAAGQSAAGAMRGIDTGRPKPSKEDVPDHSQAFSSALLEALSQVSDSAGEQGPRALSAALSRVYRAWRTDEAERRVREYAVRSFHRGLLVGLTAAATTRVRWVVAGRGCATCRAAGDVGPVAVDTGFPGIDGVPPVHPGCGCTIVPA